MRTIDSIGVVLGADNTKLMSAFRQSEAEMKKFRSEANQASAQLAAFGSSWSKYVSAPLGIAQAAATKYGMEFSKQLSLTNTMMKLQGKELDTFSSKLRSYATEVGTGAGALAQAAYPVVSVLHTNAEDTLTILEAITKASKAGFITTPDAANAIIRSMSAYSLGAEKATFVTDLLAATVEAGNASWQDMASVFPNILSLARPLGVSMQDVGAAFAVASGKAGSAEEAGTAVRGVFNALIGPSEELKALLEDIAVNLDVTGEASAGNIIKQRGFVELWKEISRWVGESDSRLEMLIPNIRGISGASALFANNGEDFAEALRRMGNMTGELDRQIAAAKGTYKELSAAMKRLENVTISMFIHTAPLVEGFADNLNSVTRAWESLNEEQQRGLVNLAKLALVVGPGASLLSKAALGVGAVGTGVATAVGAIGVGAATRAGAFSLASRAGALRAASLAGQTSLRGAAALSAAGSMGAMQTTMAAIAVSTLPNFAKSLALVTAKTSLLGIAIVGVLWFLKKFDELNQQTKELQESDERVQKARDAMRDKFGTDSPEALSLIRQALINNDMQALEKYRLSQPKAVQMMESMAEGWTGSKWEGKRKDREVAQGLLFASPFSNDEVLAELAASDEAYIEAALAGRRQLANADGEINLLLEERKRKTDALNAMSVGPLLPAQQSRANQLQAEVIRLDSEMQQLIEAAGDAKARRVPASLESRLAGSFEKGSAGAYRLEMQSLYGIKGPQDEIAKNSKKQTEIQQSTLTEIRRLNSNFINTGTYETVEITR